MAWAIWCAMVVAGCVCTDAAPASNALTPALDWAQFDSTGPDDESLGYAVSPMSGRLSAGAPWLYLLAEVPRDAQESERLKRRMPQLSIDMPMSVLRNKLNLEKERKVQALRAAINRSFLNDIGKRGFVLSPSTEMDKY
ncbi:diuretic hormone 41-like [Melitaea cinxia]|uniref:diuretic hormone 41-like n=1 Tax=Melitaea cinxia TaxID=113334 RepID=UPI001E2721DF|nr:diuretic hormone 41-like [Melitaea cinxia]